MSSGKSVHRGTRMVDRKPCGPVVVAGKNCRGMNPQPVYPDIFSPVTCRQRKVSQGHVTGENCFLSPGIMVNVVVSLVSLRVDSCNIGDATQAISNAINLQDFFGSIFYEDEQYSGFKLPSSIHNLGVSYFPESSIRFVDPLLDQLRELDLSWLDDPLPQVWSCQCYFLH
ncbi:zinc finger, CCHC-type containing protein, partial [Tanacetum coccineum]